MIPTIISRADARTRKRDYDRARRADPIIWARKLEYERARRAKKPGYKPLTLKPRGAVAPEGFHWCAHHAGYCAVDSFARDRRKKDGLQSSCRRAQAELDKLKNPRKRIVSKYNPAPEGMKWCSYHKQFEPRSEFGPATKTKRDRSGLQGSCRLGMSAMTIARFRTPKGAAQNRAQVGKHRAAKLSRVMAWADPKEIERIYANCPACHHVDHIYPLLGKLVSGLHVPDNLSYLPGPENSSKGNRMPSPELVSELVARRVAIETKASLS